MGEVNRQLTAFLRRRQALRRTWQTRSALCSQYARLDKFMRSAATELSTGLTPDLPRQEKLDGFLRSMNLSGGVVYYDKEGRLRVEVPAAEELKTRSARRELAEILGTPLREGEEENNRICLPRQSLSGHRPPWPGAPRQGEPVSGDTGIWFRREDGMLFLLLCDGMGSGPGAKQESAQAAKLIERFLRAGMDPAEAVETVSSALSLRGEAGAAPPLTCSPWTCSQGGAVSISRGRPPPMSGGEGKSSAPWGVLLPAGIVTGEQAKPDVHRFRGEQGDWIVMVTDGILCGRRTFGFGT